MSNAMNLTEDNFKDEVASGVTLVDFWAEWCGPCKMIAPRLDDLAIEFEGKAKVGKVDIEAAATIAQEYNVSSIPTLIVMKDGAEVNRFIGITDKAELAQAMNNALA